MLPSGIKRAVGNQDYGIIRDILLREEVSDVGLMRMLNNPLVYIFIEDTENIVCFCMPISNRKYDIHLHRKYRCKGNIIYQMLWDMKEWMFNNTEAVSLINFVKENNRALKLLMGSLGSKRITIIPNSSDDNQNEVMYMYNKEI